MTRPRLQSANCCIGVLAVAVGFLAAQSRPVFRSQPVPGPLLDRIRHTTWHPGCPVAPEDLRQLTLTYLDFDGKERSGTLLAGIDVADEVVRRLLGHPAAAAERPPGS